MNDNKLLVGMAAAVLLLAACGDSDDASGDGGLDGSTSVGGKDAGGDSGPTTTPPPVTTGVTCGTSVCQTTPGQAMVGAMACCRDEAASECGLMSQLVAGDCMELGRLGGVDPTCPSYDVMGLGFLTFPGCCTPAGKCGALDSSEGGLGCIPNDEIGQPDQDCTYDPNNTCTGLLPVECDGPEDCAAGQYCCGEFDGGYVQLSCRDSCAAMETPPDGGAPMDGGLPSGGVWSEICHAGQTCEVEGYTCLSNTDYLPEFLARCRDTSTSDPPATWSIKAGEINCGDTVCGKAEKCCVSYPEGEPYCADADDACRCNASGNLGGDDGGTDDAG